MFSTIYKPATALLALFSLGCSYMEVTTPTSDVVLQSLEFGADEFHAGEPLVVFASTASGDVPAQTLTLRASSGGEWQTPFLPLYSGERDPWGHHSDADLAAVIAAWGNYVDIGFKEAGTDRGVDEAGRNLTSAETSERMTEWLQQQGVTVTWRSLLIPAVSGMMDAEPMLVKEMRAHPNIDYLNPSGRVVWEGEFDALPNVLSVWHPTVDAGAAPRVPTGERVTAEYRQPDGSVLLATASIR